MKKVLLGTLVVFILIVGVAAIFFPKMKDEGVKLLYPIKYRRIVEREAKSNELDQYLVYSVIKTESGFDEKATSHADARGLMQMTDETFLWMQSVLGEEYDVEKLYDPEINIRYGCALLRLLSREYKSTDVALAAYNAGMGNVDSWLQNSDFSDDGETLTHIPFEETDNYVRRVNDALANYKNLYS